MNETLPRQKPVTVKRLTATVNGTPGPDFGWVEVRPNSRRHHQTGFRQGELSVKNLRINDGTNSRLYQNHVRRNISLVPHRIGNLPEAYFRHVGQQGATKMGLRPVNVNGNVGVKIGLTIPTTPNLIQVFYPWAATGYLGLFSLLLGTFIGPTNIWVLGLLAGLKFFCNRPIVTRNTIYNNFSN